MTLTLPHRASRLAARARAVAADDAGSSPVEFVLVGSLLTVLTLAVLQLGLAVYVRNVVHDAAVEGAYRAALADTSLADGAERTREIVTRTVGSSYAGDIQVRETADAISRDLGWASDRAIRARGERSRAIIKRTRRLW